MGPSASNATADRASGNLLDVDALAERLGVTARFVRRLVEERRVPYVKIGRFVRFDPTEVERWVVASRVDPVDVPTSAGRRRGA